MVPMEMRQCVQYGGKGRPTLTPSLAQPAWNSSTGMATSTNVKLACASVGFNPRSVNHFNVNARGFNSTLNRRVLVLQDGRDLAIAFLGSQEWNGMTQPLEDLGKVEMVRGPGSALYGANAFSGVINITTPTAREILGNRLTVSAGELESFRIDGRHASVFADGRLGLKLNGGYNTSDTYSRSRTRFDGTSLQTEYAPATDEPVPLNREVLPLAGQSLDAEGNVVIEDGQETVVTIYNCTPENGKKQPPVKKFPNTGAGSTQRGGDDEIILLGSMVALAQIAMLLALRAKGVSLQMVAARIIR